MFFTSRSSIFSVIHYYTTSAAQSPFLPRRKAAHRPQKADAPPIRSGFEQTCRAEICEQRIKLLHDVYRAGRVRHRRRRCGRSSRTGCSCCASRTGGASWAGCSCCTNRACGAGRAGCSRCAVCTCGAGHSRKSRRTGHPRHAARPHRTAFTAHSPRAGRSRRSRRPRRAGRAAPFAVAAAVRAAQPLRPVRRTEEGHTSHSSFPRFLAGFSRQFILFLAPALRDCCGVL